METPRLHFKGLNGIRAIAALSVVLFHLDGMMERSFHLPAYGFNQHGWGFCAVTMFFVLSGFLITYLLITEKEKTGTVSLKNFYIRRILRIWPLYFLIVVVIAVLTFFIPQLNDSPNPFTSWAFYFFLLPNMAGVFEITITILGPVWSIGVEEQFYAIWPVIVKKSISVKRSLIAIIIAYLILKLAARLTGNEPLHLLAYSTEIDCMALGGLGAIWFKEKSWILKWFYSPGAQITAWGLLIGSIMFQPIHIVSYIDQELCSIFFLVMILNVSTNPKTLVNLENPVMDFLGGISYGLYVYHMPVIFLVSYFHPKSVMTVYLLVLSITLGIAYISHRFFESWFIRKKDKFSAVLSQTSINH